MDVNAAPMWRATIGGMSAMAALVWLWPEQPPNAAPSPLAGEATRGKAVAGGGSPRVSAGNGIDGVTLTRAPDGHFYAEAKVNGARVRFLIDTGASVVALTREDARRAYLHASAGEFTATAQTASGAAAMKRVTIDRLELGPLEARKVEAAIAEEGLPVSLLGQSFLARVGKVEIEGGAMRLK